MSEARSDNVQSGATDENVGRWPTPRQCIAIARRRKDERWKSIAQKKRAKSKQAPRELVRDPETGRVHPISSGRKLARDLASGALAPEKLVPLPEDFPELRHRTGKALVRCVLHSQRQGGALPQVRHADHQLVARVFKLPASHGTVQNSRTELLELTILEEIPRSVRITPNTPEPMRRRARAHHKRLEQASLLRAGPALRRLLDAERKREAFERRARAQAERLERRQQKREAAARLRELRQRRREDKAFRDEMQRMRERAWRDHYRARGCWEGYDRTRPFDRPAGAAPDRPPKEKSWDPSLSTDVERRTPPPSRTDEDAIGSRARSRSFPWTEVKVPSPSAAAESTGRGAHFVHRMSPLVGGDRTPEPLEPVTIAPSARAVGGESVEKLEAIAQVGGVLALLRHSLEKLS